jgi:hypothetical protein
MICSMNKDSSKLEIGWNEMLIVANTFEGNKGFHPENTAGYKVCDELIQWRCLSVWLYT